MRKRSSRKLAGCIAIELALALTAGFAADYRAGAAASGSARALVLEDARGTRAVFTQTEFPITQALADFAAAQLLRSLDLERSGLLLHPQPDPPTPRALADLPPAQLLRSLALDPSGLPLHWSGIGARPEQPDDL